MSTILLVEDDEGVASALTNQFAFAGYEVVVANSTKSALTILDLERHIDLILADIIMLPGEPNGFALGGMARMQRPHIKLIFMTGYDDLGIDDRLLPGALFHKPVRFQSLLAEVGAQLSTA